MSGSWQPAPVVGPARPAGTKQVPMIVSAVIGVVALLAVLGIAVFTSDDASGGTLGLPGGQQGGQQLPGDQGSQGGQNGVAAGGGSNAGVSNGGGSNGGGTSSAGPAKITADQLRANFPLPPGATPATKHVDGLQPEEKKYEVHAGIASVKSYYDTKLKALGVDWNNPLTTTTTTGSGTTRITGWHGGLFLSNDKNFDGYLSIDENPLGDQPGIVVIDVTLTELK